LTTPSLLSRGNLNSSVNERLGQPPLVVAFSFLEVNGIEINASEEDAYRVFMELASGRVSEESFGSWISDNSG
jgi:prophage maintenance system killer protein